MRAAAVGLVADASRDGKAVRGLHEQSNPSHRLRVEHDSHTLLIHLSNEDNEGWTTIAVDRATRHWAVAQRSTQAASGAAAYEELYTS